VVRKIFNSEDKVEKCGRKNTMGETETSLIKGISRKMVDLRLYRMRALAERTTKESKGSAVKAIIEEHEEE